jgi:hypothetical protein
VLSFVRFATLLGGLSLATVVRADTIVTSHQVLYGTILAETVSAFRFRLNCDGRVVFIPKVSIASVRHDTRCF